MTRAALPLLVALLTAGCNPSPPPPKNRVAFFAQNHVLDNGGNHFILRDAQLTDREWAQLLDHPNIPTLKFVDLMGNAIGPDAMRTLTTHRKTQELYQLHLSINPIGNEGAKVLAEWDGLKQVQYLYLADTQITDASPLVHFRGKRLDLAFQDLSQMPVQTLTEFAPKGLILIRTQLSGSTLRTLIERTQAPFLDISENPSKGELLKVTALSPALEGLVLHKCELTDKEKAHIQSLWGARGGLRF